MDRTLLAAGAFVLSLFVFNPIRGADLACHWDDPGLRDYLTFIYGPGQNIDSFANEYYPRLEEHKEANVACLREIVLHGPSIIPRPGIPAEETTKTPEPSEGPHILPQRGLAVLPAIIALDPAGGRVLLEAQIVDMTLTNAEVVVLANQLLPPPSAVARGALRTRLTRHGSDPRDIAAVLLALIRFSVPGDASLIRGYLSSVTKQERIEIEAQLHGRLGETSPLRKALASPDRIVANSAADALLSWGYIHEVCLFLGKASASERLPTIAGIYEGYKRGDKFRVLSDSVVEKIQAAPHAWNCVPRGVALPPHIGPRDVSHDPAATWQPRSPRSN